MGTTLSPNGDSNLVWHYTNLSTLINILDSHTLYATEVSFLNDIRETSAADELFEGALARLIENGKRNAQSFAASLKTLLNFELEMLEIYQQFEELEFSRFVLCASDLSDNLYAWRTYASKGDVPCAIGLDRSVALIPSLHGGDDEGK